MSISLRERLGTLRVRLLVASALALLGLTGVVGVTLHQVFEQQARTDLRERTELLARAAAASAVRSLLPVLDVAWLESDPDFVAVRFLDAEGRVLASHPAAARVSDIPRPHASPASLVTVEGEREFVSFTSTDLGESGIARVELRTSTNRLHHDLKNVRWLFGSIFLLAGAVFAALALYLTRGVVLPLEEIRRAASRIVNGEMNVRLPVSGDREIDEIARFFHSLAERTHGTVPASRIPAVTPPRIEPTHRAS